MPGKRKTYEEKRTAILDAAWHLFKTEGYDGATIDAVLEHLGISKGTFYHYFSSKADLLEGVVERLTDQGFQDLKPLLEDQSLDPLAKMKAFLAASREWRLLNMDRLLVVLGVLLRDENAIIRQKLNRKTTARVRPYLEEILAQGTLAKVFQVDHPLETAEMILYLGQVLGESNSRDLLACSGDPSRPAAIKRRIEIYLESLGRILAAPPGAFSDLEHRFVLRINTALENGRRDSGKEGKGPRQ